MCEQKNLYVKEIQKKVELKHLEVSSNPKDGPTRGPDPGSRYDHIRKSRVCSVILVVVFAWSSGASSAPINSGLVAGYEFNGNANDVSGNGNDGVVNGATLTTDRFGNASSAYYFDGSSSITAPGAASISSVNSVSLWLKLDTLGGTQYPIDLGQNNNWIEMYPDGTFVVGAAWVSNGVLITTQLEIDQWYMLTRTYDGTDLHAYVNGQLTGVKTVAGANPVSISMGTSGWGTQDPSHPFSVYGSLDDVYIYNRALSATEVQTLYSVIPEPNTALLLGVGLVALAMKRRRTRR